jgi:uncharacterized protein YpmS
MRGCLTFIVGVLLGAGLMLLWWPKIPAGQSMPQTAGIRIQISNSYLSQIIESRTSGMGLSDVTVTSAPPSTMVVRGTLSVAVVSLPVTLQFQPVAVNGGLQVHLVEAQVGNIPLPGQLIPVIASSINSSIAQRVGKHAHVQAVRVTASGLEVAATYH